MSCSPTETCAAARKNGITLAEGVGLNAVAVQTKGYSSAELEAVLLAALSIANDDDRIAVTAADLQSATQDVIPSRDTRMLSYMEMLAVFESSSQRMLPERFQSMSTRDVQTRLDELRGLLGRRIR